MHYFLGDEGIFAKLFLQSHCVKCIFFCKVGFDKNWLGGMEPQSLKPHSKLQDQSAFFQFLTNCEEVKMSEIVFKSYTVF